MDLSLVDIDDLIGEIEKRTDYLVLAYCRHQSGNTPIISCHNSHKVWAWEVGLAAVLKNDVLNNYNREQENGQT